MHTIEVLRIKSSTFFYIHYNIYLGKQALHVTVTVALQRWTYLSHWAPTAMSEKHLATPGKLLGKQKKQSKLQQTQKDEETPLNDTLTNSINTLVVNNT